MWFVSIRHHSNAHDSIVQATNGTVKAQVRLYLDASCPNGKITLRSNFGQINLA
jgi:hypothetical protein